MKNRNKIWQPETAAYKRFQFPIHGRESVQQIDELTTVEPETHPVQEKSHPVETPRAAAAEDIQQQFAAAEKARAEQHAAQIDKIEQQSYQRGYEEGRRLGFEEATSKVASQSQQISEHHKALIDNLHKELSTLQVQHLNDREQVSVWLGQVVEEVCRQVVRREVSIQQSQIVDIIRQTLDLIPESKEYSIHVCEQDAELLREIKPDFGVPWQLLVNHELVPGDCRIVGNEGEADAHLESRLVQCLDIIRESLPTNLEAVPS